ncbi:hypothetical protein RYX36_016247 [Vicia faba]
MERNEIMAKGPLCSLRSRKALLLKVPATMVALGLFLFLDDVNEFETNYLIVILEPFSFILTWFDVVPFILWLA